jgi:putative transposase
MPNYRRSQIAGGCFFFTVVTTGRATFLADDDARQWLHEAIDEARSYHPFRVDAMVLMPDHFHMLMRLPAESMDFSRRLGAIKRNFSERWAEAGRCGAAVTAAQRQRRNPGIWQDRFWEHAIRDYVDFRRHRDYIHFNPVKHGLVERAFDWPWSTFHRHVRQGVYEEDWCGHLDFGGFDAPPEFW